MREFDVLCLLAFMTVTLSVFAVLSYWQSTGPTARNEKSQFVTQIGEVSP